jgi:hypothetical protein
MTLFPTSTSKETEDIISRFFKNARDRCGGREERRRSANDKSVTGEKSVASEISRKRLFQTLSSDSE